MQWIWTMKWHFILQAINWVEHNRGKPMTTFLCILQNQVSRSRRKKEWGWLTCFPFFLLLIPSTLNHWHFPQFAFHRSLSSAPPLGNMNFINRELFWPFLLVVHRSVWVHTWACGPHAPVLSSHSYSVSLSHSPSPRLYPLLFHPFPTDQFLNSPLFSHCLETCSMASLKWEWGEERTFSHWSYYWPQGWRDFSWKRIRVGESHEAKWAGRPISLPHRPLTQRSEFWMDIPMGRTYPE